MKKLLTIFITLITFINGYGQDTAPTQVKPEDTILESPVISQSELSINPDSVPVIQSALSLIGTPYRFGATGPNYYDCSAFIREVHKRNGINLPRTARAQYNIGKEVPHDSLQPGDLVFFSRPGHNIGHVGMYYGNGKFIHASSSGGIKISSLSSNYFTKRYKGAKRIMENN